MISRSPSPALADPKTDGSCCRRIQVGLTDPSTLDRHRRRSPVGDTPPNTHLIVPLQQLRKKRCIHHAIGDASWPYGDMRAVPCRATTSDLDLEPVEARRRMHNGGAAVASDVENDRSHFAGSHVVVHGHGATDAGVAAGFENPLCGVPRYGNELR
jgi:hypothetical protein